MTSGLTGAARTIQQAAEPVLRAMARGDPYERAEVPDLLNTVLEKVLRRLRDGRRIDDLAAYSKQTARNVFNDWARTKDREQEHTHRDADRDGSSTPLAEHLATASLSPSSRVIQRDDQRRHAPMIRQALANLAPTERCVLHLRFVEGRTSAEVADLLGYKSPAVVDTIVSRARKKIDDQLSPSLRFLARGR